MQSGPSAVILNHVLAGSSPATFAKNLLGVEEQNTLTRSIAESLMPV